MTERFNCIRCDSPLTFAGERDFHEGSRGWGFFLGDLGELEPAGATAGSATNAALSGG
jgi:hypothetical protein